MGQDIGDSGPRRGRALLAVGVSLAVAAGALVAAAPASATTPKPSASPTAAPKPKGTALALDVTGTAVLTLPAKDGLRDATAVRVRSGAKGDVDLLAVRGRKAVHLVDGVHLKRTRTGWQRTVTVHVQDLPTTGSWTVKARRSDAPTVTAKAAGRLVVGSGKPVHVAVRPAAKIVYPYVDKSLDRASIGVTGTDETGQAVPLRGTVRLDAGKLHRTRTIAKHAVSIPVTGLPLGAGVLTTTVTGPAGKKAVRRTPLKLAPTAVGSRKLALSSDTLQPVVDGLLDSVTLTTSGSASAGSPAKVSGTLTITSGRTTVASWPVPNGAPHSFSWDGRVGGVIKPAVYTATLTLRGPEGLPSITTKSIRVTKDHLPYRVQEQFEVAAGNQQGLAVHDGTFYVGYDSGDNSGMARIAAYDGNGNLLRTLNNVPLGHIAELSFSTSTGYLYAANGGAKNPTMVWALKADWTGLDLNSGASAIVDTIDLTALGNNGMVAVDDTNSRLLVFTGTTGAFFITPVALTATPSATDSTVLTHMVGQPMPITISGVPQGIEIVGSELWVYTSLPKNVNHVARYDLSQVTTMSASTTGESDLIYQGEGEGLGVTAATLSGQPAFYIGAHEIVVKGAPNPNAPNHIGMLVPVADE